MTKKDTVLQERGLALFCLLSSVLICQMIRLQSCFFFFHKLSIVYSQDEPLKRPAAKAAPAPVGGGGLRW